MCVSRLFSHSQSQRVWAPQRLASASRRRMNFTAPWAWSGLRRSCRKPGLEEGRSQAAAMGRRTLNVRGRQGGGEGELRFDCPARKGLGA